jgi:hypothetical protein
MFRDPVGEEIYILFDRITHFISIVVPYYGFLYPHLIEDLFATGGIQMHERSVSVSTSDRKEYISSQFNKRV